MKIKDARIYWNEETKAFRVEKGIGKTATDAVQFPLSLEASEGGETTQRQIISLLTEAMHFVEDEEFDPKIVFGELRKISEIEEAFMTAPYNL